MKSREEGGESRKEERERREEDMVGIKDYQAL